MSAQLALMHAFEPRPRAPRVLVAPAILDACAKGDREAFSRLFEACKDRVYAIAYYSTDDPAAAADVTQEVFLRLLSKIGQFEGRAAFSSWLHRVVANAAMDVVRARRRLQPIEPVAPGLTIDPPQAEAMERRERERMVRKALASLSPKLRIPVVLRYVEGLSYEEIADALDLSPGTVSSRLARAHLQLAEALEALRSP